MYIILNSGPIFVFITGALFFGDVITNRDIIGIALSFTGILCVANPFQRANKETAAIESDLVATGVTDGGDTSQNNLGDNHI